MADPKEDRPDAVERLAKVRGVRWEWREGNVAGKSGSDMGVVAQEVEAVFPELVHTDPSGYKKVNYAGLIGPLIEAVKELDARVQALEEGNPPGASASPGGDQA
jgi:hypothetical protein